MTVNVTEGLLTLSSYYWRIFVAKQLHCQSGKIYLKDFIERRHSHSLGNMRLSQLYLTMQEASR